MDILEMLEQEEGKLKHQLTAIQTAIATLNGGGKTTVLSGHKSSANGAGEKRTMSAAVRAKIARSARARWAKIRAENAKKAK